MEGEDRRLVELVSVLEQRLSLRIILALVHRGPMSVTELYDALGEGSNTTRGQRVDDLVNAGIVRRRSTGGRREVLELAQPDLAAALVWILQEMADV